MTAIRCLMLLCGTIFSIAAYAVDVIEKPAYTIYISSPLEQWGDNAPALADSSKSHQKREVTYRAILSKAEHLLGHPTVFQSPSSHPAIAAANRELAALGFNFPRESANYFQIELLLTLNALDAQVLIKAQSDLRQRGILAQGNPETLQARTASKKVLGTLVSLGATALAVDKFGAGTGSTMTLGTGLTSDLYTLVSKYKTGLAAVSIQVEFQEGQYAEFRRVTSPDQDRVGQLVIIYKEPKTPQTEVEVITDAVLVLSGATKTPEQIAALREEDRKFRLATWRECVARGACQ